MRKHNLISLYQTQEMLNSMDEKVDKCYNLLKKHEAPSLHKFCDLMRNEDCTFDEMSGYYVGYTIKQIGKEFDLLRFGDNYILNIELKQAQEESKILSQMRKNYYYLELLGSPIKIFTCVDAGELYEYNKEDDSLCRTSASIIAECIKEQKYNALIDPDKEFIPSKYLISPFNSTENFVKDQYFLTDAQEKVKVAIEDLFSKNQFAIFCVSANAGTGKTLLTYDIAKEYIRKGRKPTVVHCGILNQGHDVLRKKHRWNIVSVSQISEASVDRILKESSILIVDEAQRIWKYQLKLLIDKAKAISIPVIFSYDIKQYFQRTEKKDIYQFVKENYPEIAIDSRTLKNRVRTNKELASFIKNLFDIGSSNGYMDYSCVSVDYIDNIDDLKEYCQSLEHEGWMTATYTVSQYTKDSNDEISDICETNAHGVIGQEFSKVVAVMNQSFSYNEKNQLVTKSNYYSSRGMLYQIVTRAVNELKIIVFNNPKVYMKLVELKNQSRYDCANEE